MSPPLLLKVVIGFNRFEIELGRRQSDRARLAVVPPPQPLGLMPVHDPPDRSLRSTLSSQVGLTVRVVTVAGLVAYRLLEQATLIALRTTQSADDDGGEVDGERSGDDDTPSVVRSLHSHHRSTGGAGTRRLPGSGGH